MGALADQRWGVSPGYLPKRWAWVQLTWHDRGLKLSEQRMVLILAYVALAVGVIIILVPIYFCLWRLQKKRKEKEEGLEMPTIYDHHGFH